MGDVINGRSGKKWPQNVWEIEQFLRLVNSLKVRRYLEIGCRNGDTFDAVMQECEPGAFGIALDLPENEGCAARLADCVNNHNAELIIGNSRDPQIIERVKAMAPFDLVFIDGDHTYPGVKADWENYGPLSKVVAFHDINAEEGAVAQGMPVDVPTFWRTLRFTQKQRCYEEIVAPLSFLGIGIVFQ